MLLENSRNCFDKNAFNSVKTYNWNYIIIFDFHFVLLGIWIFEKPEILEKKTVICVGGYIFLWVGNWNFVYKIMYSMKQSKIFIQVLLSHIFPCSVLTPLSATKINHILYSHISCIFSTLHFKRNPRMSYDFFNLFFYRKRKLHCNLKNVIL